MRNWFEIKAAADSADIYIYDVIGDDMWGESVSAKKFIVDLNGLGEVKSLNVRINSPGGSVFDGVAIYNALVRHPASVDVHIDGMALSIASVIAMAGDTISIAENGMMMIHDPWVYTAGNSAELRKQAEILDKAKSGMLSNYSARTGLSDDEISEMMSSETWMTAAEAVDKGFADSVTESVKMAAHFDLSMYKHPPILGRKTGPARKRIELIELE